MWQTILGNLEAVGWAFSLFCMCVLSNILAKTYYNTKNLKQEFSLSRMGDGLLKMICVGVATALLAIVAGAVPYIPVLGEIFQSDELKDLVSFIVIVTLYAKAIIKYYTSASKGIDNILENYITESVATGDTDG